MFQFMFVLQNKEQVEGFTPTGDRQFFFVILVADGLFLYLSGCAGGYIYLNTYPRVSVISGLCRGVRLSECGGSEADPDIPGIKTLKDPVHYDVRKTWKTEFRLYTTCKGFKGFSRCLSIQITTLRHTIIMIRIFCNNPKASCWSTLVYRNFWAGQQKHDTLQLYWLWHKVSVFVTVCSSYLMCSQKDKDPGKTPALSDLVMKNWGNKKQDVIDLSHKLVILVNVQQCQHLSFLWGIVSFIHNYSCTSALGHFYVVV